MIRRFLILLLFISGCLAAGAQSDTLAVALNQELPTVQEEPTPADTTVAPAKPPGWFRQLADTHFNFKDTTIRYPKFVGFLVNVYNWGDEFFNGTDPEYVQGTGRRWKVLVKNDNWLDSYLMDFDHMNMRMMSDIYMGAGVYVQYMAVSVGYMLDMSNIIGNKPMNHKKLELGFNCQRFNIEAFYNENTGGTYLRSFGDYKGGRLIRKEFPGLKLKQYGIHGYYFFNNREYSNGAAYSYSRIQKRSAGSFILGFGYSNLDINLDFRTLPYPLKLFMKIPIQPYVFHYDTYNLLIGYGYNWVFKRNFLFNITALPAPDSRRRQGTHRAGLQLQRLLLQHQRPLRRQPLPQQPLRTVQLHRRLRRRNRPPLLNRSDRRSLRVSSLTRGVARISCRYGCRWCRG